MKDYSYFISHKALPELYTVIPFLMVGSFTAIVYFALFTVFWKFLHIHYEVALSIAFITAASIQFFLNRNLTFKSYNRNVIWQFVKYLTMMMVNYLITLLIVKSIVEILHWSPYVGSVVSIAVTVVTGYLMGKFWVFKQSTNIVEET